MRITFTSLSPKKESLSMEHTCVLGNNHLAEHQSALPLAFGKFYIKTAWLNEACIFVSSFDTQKPAVINISCDSFCWLMNFVIDGELDIKLNENKKQSSLCNGGYHTFYTPLLKLDITCKQKSSLLTICLSRSFIQKIFGVNELPGKFVDDIPEPITLVSKGNYEKSRMETLITDILNAGQPTYIRRIFLEARILELLSLQLEQQEVKPEFVGLNADEQARLLEARQLIEQNLKTPCSLIELSRKTGLNDFKLKKGFKILFGNTVFGYLGELRMTTAYKLLQQGERVGTVAETVGYKNPHHFTAAFKKRYKLLPSQVIRFIFLLVNLGAVFNHYFNCNSVCVY